MHDTTRLRALSEVGRATSVASPGLLGCAVLFFDTTIAARRTAGQETTTAAAPDGGPAESAVAGFSSDERQR